MGKAPEHPDPNPWGVEQEPWQGWAMAVGGERSFAIGKSRGLSALGGPFLREAESLFSC